MKKVKITIGRKRMQPVLLAASLAVVLPYLSYSKSNHDAKPVNVSDNSEANTISSLYLETQINLDSQFANIYDGEASTRDNMKFSSKDTVEKLKNVYDGIKYFDEFKETDPDDYDYYAEKYTQLLKSEVEFYYPRYKKYATLSLFGYDVETLLGDYYNTIYTYLIFDMDEDGEPELCLTGGSLGAYVFKYSKEADQYSVWWDGIASGYQIMGSRKVMLHYLNGNYKFIQLSKTGDEACTLFFYDSLTTDGTDFYMVSLPTYSYGFRDDDISESMRNDGYYDTYYYGGELGRCFFRVTKKEYYELTDCFFDGSLEAYMKLEDFRFYPKLE